MSQSHAETVHPQPTQSVVLRTGKTVRTHVSKTKTSQSLVKVDQIASQTAFGNPVSTGNNIVFDIRGNRVTFAKRIMFSLRLLNNGATPATLVNLPFIFQNISLLYNGAEPLPNFNPELFWNMYMPNYDMETTRNIASTQNWDPETYISHVAGPPPVVGVDPIPSGQARTYYFEFDSILNQARVPISEDLVNYWQIRFDWANNIMVSSSGSPATASISVVDMKMFIVGDMLSHPEKKLLRDEMASMPHSYHGYLPQRQIFNLGPLGNNTQFNFTLTGFQGFYNQFLFFIRQSNAGAENQYQFSATNNTGPELFQLEGITFKKGDGSPCWVNNLPDALQRLIIDRLYYPSIYGLTFRQYRQIFSGTPVAAVMSGMPGGMRIDSNWQIEASTTLTNGLNCDIVLIGMRSTRIEIDTNKSVSLHYD